MARERLCKVCGGWHRLDAWPSECFVERRVARADFPTPMMSLDSMDPLRSMVDGQLYDSKSALRRSYRERGYIEIGNETQKMPEPPKGDPKARKQAVVTGLKKAGVWDELRD